MDAGNSPLIIQQNQVAMMVNCTTRGGFLATRPIVSGEPLTYPDDGTTHTRLDSGVFQGACWYDADDPEATGIIIARGGRQFRIAFVNNSRSVQEITAQIAVTVVQDFTVPGVGLNVTVFFSETDELIVGLGVKIDTGLYTVISIDGASDSAVLSYSGGAAHANVPRGTSVYHQDGKVIFYEDLNADGQFSFLFQAENYIIVCQASASNVSLPLIFDGSTMRRSLGDAADPPELPAGFCGAYVNGRIWLAMANRRNYIGCDLVGSSSGTASKSFIDAILKSSQNTFINEGGAFSIPANAGKICGINATVVIDTSLGQGPVSVYCQKSVFTNSAPPDSATWKDLTYPIQTVAAIDFGAVGPRAIVNVNQDTWFRSPDGQRSFIIGRRDLGTGWGNTPMSNEIGPILDRDQKDLLLWVSSALFNNRLLTTCSPKITPQGIVFQALSVMNYDEVSGMRGKTNPAWEGVWTGLDIFQILTGKVDDVERCFLIVRGTSGETEVWELHYDKDGINDYRIVPVQGGTRVVSSQIECLVDFRAMTFAQPKDSKKLESLQWFYDEIFDTVTWSVSYRPDMYPAFIPWHSVTVCQDTNACDQTCGTATDKQPGYNPYQCTPLPPDTCLANGRPANYFYHVQPRIQWRGHARITWVQLQAMMAETEPLPDACVTAPCLTVRACDASSSFLGYSSRG